MTKLEIKDLLIKSKNETIVNKVNITLNKGEITALVGRSGSGKTLISTALRGFLPTNLDMSGEVFFNEKRINSKSKIFSTIMQNPKSAFNPLFTMGETAKETILATNEDFSKEKVLNTFEKVGLKEVERVYNLYPFEMSGGMLQRVMIALALLQKAEFIIADEPTTDLDLIVQSKILDVLQDIVKKENIGILLITHDIGVVAKIANNVFVIDKGEIKESNSINKIFSNPKEDITKQLINAHLSLYDGGF